MRRLLLLGVALIAVSLGGVVAGLASGGSGSIEPGLLSSATAVATQPTAAQTSTSPSAAQLANLSQPPVKVAPAVATVPSRELPGHNRPTISLGDMNTPEQFVLGALYTVALRAEGFTVNASRNIGNTAISQLAIQTHTLDVYPQYLDTWDLDVAHKGRDFANLAAAYTAGETWAAAHHYELLTPSPGADTVGFAVTRQFAEENHVHSLADLGRLTQLTFGVPINFGGLWRAERAYGFSPGTVQAILTGTQYDSLRSGSVQVAYASTTDPQLSGPRYTLLSDPLHVYGFGNIVPVTTKAVIHAEGPAFVTTLNRVDALLTTRALQGLNDEVLLEKHDAMFVAQEFLQGNGLLPAQRYMPGK